MRDPNFTMQHKSTNGISPPKPPPAMNGTRRGQNRSVRVSFGLEPDSGAPSRDRSPSPLNSHPRPFTATESTESSSTSLVPAEENPPEENNPDSTDHNAASRRSSASARPGTLQRARSDFGPRSAVSGQAPKNEEDDFAMRHGWQEEYTSTEYLKLLHSVSRPF